MTLWDLRQWIESHVTLRGYGYGVICLCIIYGIILLISRIKQK